MVNLLHDKNIVCHRRIFYTEFDLKSNPVSFHFSTRRQVLVLMKKKLAHYFMLSTCFYILFR